MADRRGEALLLDDVLRDVRAAVPGEEDVLLVGDFNLPPDDAGLDELRQILRPVFPAGTGTTIADNDLDNVWLDPEASREYTGVAGVDRFDESAFAGDDDAASLAVSDHRPLWLRFATDGPDDDGTATLVRLAGWGQLKACHRPD